MILPLKSFLILCGVSVVGVSSAALSGAFSSVAEGIKELHEISKQYKQYDCYKWFYEKEKGDFSVCFDEKRDGAFGESPIFFDLWWRGNNSLVGPWPHYEIEKIKVTNKNELTFSLKDGTEYDSDKKITVAIAPRGSLVTKWSDRLENLEKLNDKKLKDVCKLSTKSGSNPLELICSSEGYTAKNLDYNALTMKKRL